jgi:hypothetical protein
MRFRCWVFFLSVWVVRAEQGVLVVHVRDLHDHPIENVRFRAGRLFRGLYGRHPIHTLESTRIL